MPLLPATLSNMASIDQTHSCRKRGQLFHRVKRSSLDSCSGKGWAGSVGTERPCSSRSATSQVWELLLRPRASWTCTCSKRAVKGAA